ncbi:hypothetical protein [Agathobaculum sp.]|uniref:hypothetical protein n=1 Tax=Agathobaculum sp. TaxID=2048138 RepID=UPI002A7F1720|nr:hypothetical protein [Agathobaculum sp.]MDY3617415.1 hypothetical protein [Agathobaculum sp.]
MRERLFPRWGAALFALLPFSEILYARIDGQTAYAAAIASLFCALVCAGCVRLAPFWRQYRVLVWGLALFSVWPLTRSLARMGLFVQRTAFPTRPLWSLILLLTVAALLLARVGLIRCAMWSLPTAAAAGVILALSGLLTLREHNMAYFEAPMWSLWTQTGALIRSMLPAALALSLAMPEGLSAAAVRGFSAGGALFALISLRAVLLLGAHTAALLPYPNFAAAGLAAVGDFARHGEVFFAVPLVLCDLGRAAALACVLIGPFAQAQKAFRAQKKDA